MEVVLDCVQSGHHDSQWCLQIPGSGIPTCLACCIEDLEASHIPILKKKTVLSNFLQVTSHLSSALVPLLGQNIPITCHIIFTLLELMKVCDEAVISMATEACLNILQTLQSEDLVCFLLDGIADNCEKTSDHLQSNTLHVLLGKLLKMIPNLPARFLKDHGTHLNYLINGLQYPSEPVQSAIVVVLVQLCDKSVQKLIPLEFISQVPKTALLLLNGAREERLLGNTLVLMKKLLLFDGAVDTLMQIDVDGVTLLSVLRRMMSMKIPNLHLTCVQILLLILQSKHDRAEQILNTDLIEFLFEALDTKNIKHLECLFSCLVPLVKLDTFYLKCHSIYGIESLLNCLHTLYNIKTADLLEIGLAVLTEILERQPKTIPLFVNSWCVNLCLTAIQQGLEDHKHPVFKGAMAALVAVMRTEHLLLPLPFDEIGSLVQTMGTKVVEQIRNKQNRICSGLSKATKRYKQDTLPQGEPTDILELLLQVAQKCCSLLVVSSKNPACCRNNFMAPSSADSTSVSDVEVFKKLIIQLCDQTCIPTTLTLWERADCTKEEGVHVYFLSILLQLYEITPGGMIPTFLKLAQSGFLIAVSDIRANPSCCTTLKETSLKFLLCLSNVLVQQDVEMGTSLPDCVSSGLQNIYWKISNSMSIVSCTDETEETQLVLIMILYLSYRAGDRVFHADDLSKILSQMLSTLPKMENISPFFRKQLVFLVAVGFCQNGYIDLTRKNYRACEDIEKMIKTCDPSTWYTHDIVLVRWCLSDATLSLNCVPHILKVWLELSDVDKSDTDGNEAGDQSCSSLGEADILVEEYGMDQAFLEALVFLVVSTPELSQKVFVIIRQIILKNQDKKEFVPVLSNLTSRAATHLNNLFLDSKSSECSVNCLLTILCMVYGAMKKPPAIDVKLLYHVMKLLVKKTENFEGLKKGLQLLIAQFPDSCANVENKGVPLVVQNEELMENISLWIKGDNLNLHLFSLQLLSKLVCLCSSETKVLDILHVSGGPPYSDQSVCLCIRHVTVRVTLDVERLISCLNTDNIHGHLIYLGLLQSLFECGLHSPIVQFRNQDRGVGQTTLSHHDYKHLLIFLQQFIIQEIQALQVAAIGCLEKMFIYLVGRDKCLAENLVSQPWNRFLLDILLESQMLNYELLFRFLILLLTTDSGIKTVKPKLPTIISILTGIHDPTAEEFHEYRRELADKILDLFSTQLSSQESLHLKQCHTPRVSSLNV